ncbi:hypothetical protein FRB90_009250 [Tulasnella sp. 427]|nr:hypothetical protein FRB90_009250 [Tulasnella sp. 427]
MGDSLVPSGIAASGAVDQLRAKHHLYILPADEPEHQRLDLQQELLTRIRHGLFLCKEGVRRTLNPKAGVSRPVALDLGCGSGFWTVEMAKQFPEVEVVGIDLFIPDVPARVPSNCRFEQYDLNDGLPHYRASVNVVHASCVAQGIMDFPWFMDQVWEALRPGGVFLTVSGDMQMYDENKQPWTVAEEDDGESSFSYHVLLMTELWKAMKSKGPGILSYPNISRWLQDMGREKWEDIGLWNTYVPIGPWKEDMTEHEKHTSDLMRQNMLKIHQVLRSSLHASGVPEETTQRWTNGAGDELLKLQKRMYCHWLFNWAVKVDGAAPSRYD